MLCVALTRFYSQRDNTCLSPQSNESTSNNNTAAAETMNGVFENALNAGKTAGKKAKIRAEIALLDRKIPARKKAFGIELYDELSVMTCSQDFYATSDQTISTIRPHLLSTDREIRALSNKKLQVKGDLDIAMARRAEAFPTNATNWKEKAANAATATAMMSNETKIKTHMALVDTQMNAIKERFGITIFPVLEDLFAQLGTSQLPVHCATDKDVNTIRFLFQKCITDIDEINRTRRQKLGEIDSLTADISLRRL